MQAWLRQGAVVVALALSAPAGADEQLNIICSVPIPWCEAAAKAFT